MWLMTSNSLAVLQSDPGCPETPWAAEAMQGQGVAGFLGIATFRSIDLGSIFRRFLFPLQEASGSRGNSAFGWL